MFQLPNPNIPQNKIIEFRTEEKPSQQKIYYRGTSHLIFSYSARPGRVTTRNQKQKKRSGTKLETQEVGSRTITLQITSVAEDEVARVCHRKNTQTVSISPPVFSTYGV